MTETEDPCSNFCCSDFVTYQDAKLTGSPDLLMDIHPVFAREHFPEVNIDYSLIETPLRLASRFLALDAVVRLILVKAEGELRRDTAWGRPVLTNWEEIDALEPPLNPVNISRHAKSSQNEVSPTMRARADQLLSDTVGMSRFYVNAVSQGSTQHSDLPLPSALAKMFLRGCRNTCIVPKEVYRGIQVSNAALRSSTVAPEAATEHRKTLLMCQLGFAIQIIHEFFHALENIYNGHRQVETFCGDQCLAECGYAVEHAIFGGILKFNTTLIDSTVSGWCKQSMKREELILPVVILYDWPSKVFRDMYAQKKWKMGARRSNKLSDKVSRVPWTFVQDLFREEAWSSGRFMRDGRLAVPCEGVWKAMWDPDKARPETLLKM